MATAAERRATRRFVINLEFMRPLNSAAESDRLGDTIDYRRVCEIALATATNSTFRLLETLAGRIAKTLQEEYPGVAVIIEIEKLAPPCPGVPKSCGVRMRWEG